MAHIEPRISPNGLPVFEEVGLEKYWNTLHPEILPENETARLVRQVKDIKYDYLTIADPIRSADDLKNYMNKLQGEYPNNLVGASISSATFNYDPNNPTVIPSNNTFKHTKAISIDIDTHIVDKRDPKNKARFELHPLDMDQLQYAIIVTWIYINRAFKKNDLGLVIPQFTMLTGAGLQMILEFERELNQDETAKLFGLIKNAIGSLKYKIALHNVLEYSQIAFDIDPTIGDISHVQRVCGIINQKYGVQAVEIPVFKMTSGEIVGFAHELKEKMDETGHPDESKSIYKDEVSRYIDEFNADRKIATETFEVNENLMTAKMQSSRVSIRPSELQSIEYELLIKIKESGIRVLDILAGEIKIGQTTGNLTKLYCPFHEESNPSMAFYENDLTDVFRDFHDDTTYNLISFWQNLFDVSKTEAITKISDICKIKLGKAERKDFQDLEIDEIVTALIKRVDVEDFVYYRLASKNRNCIVRHINSGESFLFDGPQMLATHVLSNQLGIDDAERKLIQKFVDRFVEKILIEAFEEFQPGKPTVFSKQFIKFVNLWVPSDNYKMVHSQIQESDEATTIPETINLLRERCPWTYKYVLQLVQKGDLEWFINWLSAVSKFKVMPTVPVVFGVQGAGKNLFVSTIMDFYLNNEYVKILNGDRIMNNFNSVLETASLIVLDEGDFSSGKEVDQLKLLTGNNKILVEKKGIDATNKERHFNFLFFSNGEVPVRHPAMDRRITYFKNEFSLLRSCEAWDLPIDIFIERVQNELVDFWAIIYKTDLNRDYTMANKKNGQFWEQIMKMHPFGNLIMKLINKNWDDIALQLNENVTEPSAMSSNLTLLNSIRGQFEKNGKISLALINRYLQSMSYKTKTPIQYYIQINHLDEFGIGIEVKADDVLIVVDKKKVQKAVTVENILTNEFPAVIKQKPVSPLEAQSQENHIYATTTDIPEENFNLGNIPGLDIPEVPPLPAPGDPV